MVRRRFNVDDRQLKYIHIICAAQENRSRLLFSAECGKIFSRFINLEMFPHYEFCLHLMNYEILTLFR